MPTPILNYNPPYGFAPVPTPPGPAIRWEYHPEIVALMTVDGEPSLQQLVTAQYFLVGSRVELNISADGADEAQSWGLKHYGVLGESDVVPDDYDSHTNSVVWGKLG